MSREEPLDIHCARPKDPDSQATQPCAVCDLSVKRVPGDQWPIWVHERNGYVVGDGADPDYPVMPTPPSVREWVVGAFYLVGAVFVAWFVFFVVLGSDPCEEEYGSDWVQSYSYMSVWGDSEKACKNVYTDDLAPHPDN